MNENEEKIYDLISSKSFAELTEDEKALVLESLGSEELYEKMREANLAAEEALSDDLPPPPEMKASVMAAFEEKDEKRGIAWWKYAAAVAVLVVGAFVLWPSGNLEREPIAENVERKDSTELKKAAPAETKSTIETEVQNESTAQSEELKPPTTTSSESVEITDELIVAESESTSPEEEEEEEEEAEKEMDFDNEYAEGKSLSEIKEDVLIVEHDGALKETNDVQTTSEIVQPFDASDSFSVGSNEFSKPKMNVESARTATTMSSDLMKQEAPFEGISLKSIGGPDRNAYVAY